MNLDQKQIPKEFKEIIEYIDFDFMLWESDYTFDCLPVRVEIGAKPHAGRSFTYYQRNDACPVSLRREQPYQNN